MINEIIRNTVEKHPQKTALLYDGSSISYESLYNDVAGLNSGLHSLGVAEGDCVALILPNCPEFVVSFLAAAQLHAISLLVNPALAEEEVKYYLSDSSAKAIITDKQRADMCRKIIADLNKGITLIVIGDGDLTDVQYNTLIKSKPRSYSGGPRFEGDAIYQYSSGSTGRPKRVVRTQKNLWSEAYSYHSTVNTTSSDNILCVVPFFHAHGLGNCLMASVYTGATLTILEDLKKNGKPVSVPFVLRRERVLELIDQEKITMLPGVPFVFSALAETPADYPADMSSIRICFSAGNFLPEQTFEKFRERFGIPVRQLYGCTEVGSFSINLDNDDAFHFDSVGLPMKNNEVIILDDEGQPVPDGTTGEITIRSGALTSGYCNLPELNSTAFKDGFFLTGDLGRRDQDGRLYITGRKKIFIEVGGNKVDPLEIEDVLIKSEHVKEVVVVGAKGLYDGELIKAVIVPEGNCKERDIVMFCRSKLATFKVPQLIEFREEIPKSPLGKILRKNLV